MGRAPCCEKIGLKRGRWTAEEDQLLVDYIKAHGEGGWRSLPKNAGLLRCGKSCRLRWVNYLREDLKRGNISPEEEETILKLQATLGNRWSLIAGHLPGRTDNEIKNYWNAHLSKKAAPAPRTAAKEPGSEGEDGGGGEPGSSSDHDGDVCSEDARSTVVNEEKDGQDGSSDDCATSCVLPKRSRKRKAKDNSGEKKKKKECKKEESKEKEKAHSRTKVNTVAGGAKKKQRSPSGKKGSDHDSCDCRSKEGKRAAAVVVDRDPGEENTEKKEFKKKRKNKKLKLPEPAAGAETTDNVHQAGAAAGDIPPVITPTEAKEGSEPGDSCCGAASIHVTHRPVDLRPAAHVEDAVETANGDTVLDVSVHLEDPAMGLDLLEAIDDSDMVLLITAGSSDPHDGMLLNYMGVSGSDGACCWDGAPLGEEADSKTGEWSDSSAGSSQATMFGSCEGIMNPAGGSTKSSYMDLQGEPCQPCVGSPAGPVAEPEDGIGSLQWEAEDDVWKLLSKFFEIEADVGDQQQQQPVHHVQQQQQPDTTQGFVSGIGSCGDDVFVDGAFDSPWLMADMFLS